VSRPADPTTLFGFDGTFLRRLERLAIINRRPVPGPTAGPRRSPRRGSSVEFADFREYSPGDDFRRIDWNTYARLDRLFLRLYVAEEVTTLSLLIDRSRSMTFGDPTKLLTAARLAAVLSFIALHGYDRVAVAGWGGRLDRYAPPLGGKTSIPEVWRSIAATIETVDEATDFAALRAVTHLHRGPGLCVVLTDLLTETDWRSGIRALRAAGQEVSLIQILAPAEIDPPVRGDWRLRDAETSAEVEITASPRVLKRYLEELQAYQTEIRDFCRKQNVAYILLPSDVSIQDMAMRAVREGGLVG
jgi:uncharacterized protein (DUF58 family)